MFTGIVEEIGRVQAMDGAALFIAAGKTLADLAIGGSIAVNGTCLTAVSVAPGAFSAEVTPESLSRTNLGRLTPGDGVNLERPLAVSGRLGGHIVQGHVDGVGEVIGIVQEGNSRVMRFRAPTELMRYIVPKGFIAVDGISLTVVEVQGGAFTVSVIPTTYRETVLGVRREGDMVNLEADVIAKYVERLLHQSDR